jgi:hypothetical protein
MMLLRRRLLLRAQFISLFSPAPLNARSGRTFRCRDTEIGRCSAGTIARAMSLI